MQLTITLDGLEKPEAIANLTTALEGLYGITRPMAVLDSRINHAIDEIVGSVLAGNTSFKTAGDAAEAIGGAVAVEFGKQPLPDGVHFTAHNEVTGPLAPPAPPAAGAVPSATAPEATTGSSAAPAAPPVPPAPPAAATQPPAPVGEVDKNGLPWDERIHSGSRAKVADGGWRMKRGVDATKVAEVEAELRGQAVAAPPPPPPAANPLDNLKPEAAPLPPAAPALTFGMVAKRVTAKLTLGELTTAELTKRLAELGFPDGLHTINARPDMWLTVLETLGA